MTSVWIVYYMTCQEVSIIYGVFDNQEEAEACRQRTRPELRREDIHADIMEIPFNTCLLKKPECMG